MKYLSFIFICTWTLTFAQRDIYKDPFRQLDQQLPTPNDYRNASGAPGHKYWQQQADYNIQLELNDDKQTISGQEVITYKNNSPDVLPFIWLQLDQNMRAQNSQTYEIGSQKLDDKMSEAQVSGMEHPFDGGFKLEYVKDNVTGADLKKTINYTMMRVDLPKPLNPGQSYSFKIKWWYNINDRMKIGGRSGYEYMEEDKNYIYTIAQFYPRMCVYNDIEGWQNKQFLGQGEFTVGFGNFDVAITVPSDHLVAATGEIQNTTEVLTKEQIALLAKAKNERVQPVIIASQKEAEARELKHATTKKTWKFKAINVRDFAFASSRKFIWDAMGVPQSDGRVVMAQSMYPKEGNPLWEKYSTKAVAHTLKWYSYYTFDYPYPSAWSINTDKIGMEYPMICFNGGRCEKDGTYSRQTKYATIGVIIHEVGHNYFPMIVNNDERQWTWMDEGLNTFLQYLAEVQWEPNYPTRRGPANLIVPYMKLDEKFLEPIMTNSESIQQLGSNSYAKVATGLNILRETVMGRELFDMAFKEYSRRWAFKQPYPADFFRTMEEASGVDLDWFWNGWFYSTDYNDISMSEVKWMKVDPKDPTKVAEMKKEQAATAPQNISKTRNMESIDKYYSDMDTTIRDFYSTYDANEPDAIDQEAYKKSVSSMSEDEKKLMATGDNFYEVTFERKGGLIMPVIVQLQYADGTKEDFRYPAEVWKKLPENKITKVFRSPTEVTKFILDPYLETADINTEDNQYPRVKEEPSRFEVFKQQQGTRENEMQRAKRAKAKS
ncbi:MAG: M1 family metallopeptidase [Saprospiraceae bacterium]|nr:M1 family metallopeptidase [Saprospiraceae bacterium]MBP8944279.1 M1 family metallopeptidase [Saprospiraceae bacterium]